MKRNYISLVLALALSLTLTACNNSGKKTDKVAKEESMQKDTDSSKAKDNKTADKADDKKPAEESKAKKDDKDSKEGDAVAKPGESGFNEIPIGEATEAGPFNVEAVYFQGVDMVPENKQPSGEESDMHLEADIHLKPEAAKIFGFGDGENIWPAYLTVNYKVMSADGKKEITSGTFMPMNADDGPHYGINIKKGVIPVGKYKLILEIKASDDYLLHVDSETGIPVAREEGKAAAVKYYEKQTVSFDWNYDASQLTSK